MFQSQGSHIFLTFSDSISVFVVYIICVRFIFITMIICVVDQYLRTNYSVQIKCQYYFKELNVNHSGINRQSYFDG